MAVDTIYSPVVLSGNGTTKQYGFAWQFIDNKHVKVYLNGVLQVEDDSYRLEYPLNKAYGTVVFTEAPADGVVIKIVRETPQIQDKYFPNQEQFNASRVEDAFDRQTMIAQEQQIGIEVAQAAVGPQGPVGPVGPQGPKGDTGPQGIAGPVGATGSQGPKGDTGPVGPQGPRGPQGEPGIGLTYRNKVATYADLPTAAQQGDAYQVQADGLFYIWGDSGFPAQGDGAVLQGPQGETGPRGPQGIQGVQGEKGDTGATGPQGIQGEKGDTGETGPQGPAGVANVVFGTASEPTAAMVPEGGIYYQVEA